MGVGINFNVNTKEIEKKLKDTPNFYGVTSLKKFKKNTTKLQLIQSFLVELEKVLERLNKGNTKKIIDEWTKKSSTIGKTVAINTKKGKVVGKALKIDEDGALIISGKKTVRVLAGDVVHLPK